MVMEYLGPNLESTFNSCHRNFSLKTTLMVTEQMVGYFKNLVEKNRDCA